MLIWCCGSTSCVMCELHAVENDPGYGCASQVVSRESLRMIEWSKHVGAF